MAPKVFTVEVKSKAGPRFVSLQAKDEAEAKRLAGESEHRRLRRIDLELAAAGVDGNDDEAKRLGALREQAQEFEIGEVTS